MSIINSITLKLQLIIQFYHRWKNWKKNKQKVRCELFGCFDKLVDYKTIIDHNMMGIDNEQVVTQEQLQAKMKQCEEMAKILKMKIK